MNILITGFEPFGNHNKNNSWDIAKSFKGTESVIVLQLPVSFSQAHKEVIDQIEKHSFEIIIMLGEASSFVDYIRLERVAINFKDSINGDNDGLKPDEEILIKNAPNAYFTKFPLKRIACKLKATEYPVKISTSAGTFVCNSLYFHTLHYIEATKLTTKALFIHVPSTTQIIPLEEMKNIVNEIIKISLSYKDE